MTSEEIDRAQEGKLEIRCQEITVSRALDGHAFRGPGSIYLEDGRLRFQLYSVEEGDPWEDFAYLAHSIRAGVPVGEVIPKERYFTLTATDVHERNWTAEYIIPDGIAARHSVIWGDLGEAEHAGPELYAGDLTVHVFDDTIKFPCTVPTLTKTVVGELGFTSASLDAARIVAAGSTVWMRRLPGRTTIHAAREEGLVESHYPSRLVEAMQFVFGRPIEWSVMDRPAGTRLRTTYRNAAPMRLRPPVAYQRVDDLWRLFDAYLRHVLADSREGWHPLSTWIESVILAGSSPHARALAICVAVEGVLAEEFKEKGIAADPADVKAMLEHIDQLQSPLKPRVVGLVNMTRDVRAMDRLRVLQREGVVTAEQVAAWQKLRNESAHAAPHDSQSVERVVRLTNTVQMLLYRLIFAAVGYTGPYTDYSQPDHLATFP